MSVSAASDGSSSGFHKQYDDQVLAVYKLLCPNGMPHPINYEDVENPRLPEDFIERKHCIGLMLETVEYFNEHCLEPNGPKASWMFYKLVATCQRYFLSLFAFKDVKPFCVASLNAFPYLIDKPDNVKILFAEARSRHLQAKLDEATGQSRKAINGNLRSYAALQEAGNPDWRCLAEVENDLGVSYNALGEHERALESFERSKTIFDNGKAIQPPEHEIHRARCLILCSLNDGAEEILNKLITSATANEQDAPRILVEANFALASGHRLLGKNDDAKEGYLKAYKLLCRGVIATETPYNHPMMGACSYRGGALLLEDNQLDEAIICLRASVDATLCRKESLPVELARSTSMLTKALKQKSEKIGQEVENLGINEADVFWKITQDCLMGDRENCRACITRRCAGDIDGGCIARGPRIFQELLALSNNCSVADQDEVFGRHISIPWR